MRSENLLFLFSDEHEARVLGAAGHPLARTPNLDRLAARGTRFTSAWTPSPICVPARASLATGRYVHDIGYWDNALAYDGRVPGWGHRLQAGGIRVEAIGKLHYRNDTDPTGFDRQIEPTHILGGIGQVWGSVRDPMPESAGRSPLFAKFGAGESSYNRYDRRVAEHAIRWLQERARSPDKKPWVLFVGFVAPHFPLVVPQGYIERYPLDAIALPKLLPRDGLPRHPWVEAQARHMDHDASLGTDERRRLALASYYGLCTLLDEQIGRVLQALEATGLEASTRVIYTSDHGDNLGARGMWNKCLLYRESTGVPLIISGRDVARGEVCATNASLVDVYPSVLDCVGLEPTPAEAALPGKSLFRMASEPDDAERLGFSEYHAVGSVSAAFMLKRGRFKYHHYVGFAPELFDLDSDPEEARNLAGDPRCRDTLAGFEAQLRAMLDPEEVDRQAKRDQAQLVERFGGREKALKTGTPGATPVPDAPAPATKG
jgi:choline-sulfatase